MRNEKKISDRTSVSASDMEQNNKNTLDKTLPDRQFHKAVCIHIHSIRNKPVDPDGISAKALIDGIVETGLLVDDSPAYVKEVTYSQDKGKEEKTIVTIEEV